MTAAGEVLTVHRADVDTPCRRCRGTIARGQRVALLAAVGAVHLRCILAIPPAERSHHEPEETTLTRPEPQAAVAGDVDEDETWPAAEWPGARTPPPDSVPLADEDDQDDQDPRATPWWDR